MLYLKNNYKMIYFNQRKIMNENEMMQILSNDYKVKLKKYIAKNIKYSIIINEKLIKHHSHLLSYENDIIIIHKP